MIKPDKLLHNPPIPKELIEAINSHSNFVILGHKNPDADCLNSQLVLGSTLTYLGKEVVLLSPGPFDRHEIKNYREFFHDTIPPDFKKTNPLAIIIDCSTPDRISPLEKQIEGLTTAIIDHHASGTEFGDIRFISPKAFSVTFLIFHIMKVLDIPVSKLDAQRLLFGLAADTGFFRHIPEGRPEIFEMITSLSDAGASPKDVYHTMYGERSFNSKKLLGLLLSRTERLFDGRLLMTWETLDEHTRFGEKERDSESLYAQLLSVVRCEVVVYIRQEKETSCTVGFRTAANSSVDVGRIASSFGGGGHKKASGATLEMNLEKAKTAVIELIANYILS